MNEHVDVIVHYYSSIALLEKLNSLNIPIYQFKMLEPYVFLLTIDPYNDKKIKKNF